MAKIAPVTAPIGPAPKFGEYHCVVCGKPIATQFGTGHTCARTVAIGKGKYYLPLPAGAILPPAPNAQYIALSALCRKAEAMGSTAGFVVRLTGRDAGIAAPAAPVWQVYTQGTRKYCAIAALAALTALLAPPAKK